jgi:hypothetical protein
MAIGGMIPHIRDMSNLPDARALRIETCRTKAGECREMAGLTQIESHRIMLRHMADTWDRIAADIEWLGTVQIPRSPIDH